MRHPPERLEPALAHLVPLLEAQHDVRFAFLHGSAAEGLPFRDLDVAVWLDPCRDPLQRILRLGAQLERSCGLPVDVHALNEAPAGFAYHVSRGRLLVSRDEELLADWRERVWTAWFAYEPHLRRMFSEQSA